MAIHLSRHSGSRASCSGVSLSILVTDITINLLKPIGLTFLIVSKLCPCRNRKTRMILVADFKIRQSPSASCCTVEEKPRLTFDDSVAVARYFTISKNSVMPYYFLCVFGNRLLYNH